MILEIIKKQFKMNDEKKSFQQRLASRIKNKKSKNLKSEKISKQNISALGLGLKLATDFVVTIIVGCLIGLGVDKMLETKPIFFLIFLFLGIAGAFLNIYRTVLSLNNR